MYDASKVKFLIDHSKIERGKRSEEFVLTVSEVLKKEGKIINYYHTSAIKKLDKRGIDVIYQTKNGFYAVQVKSSKKGAEKHQLIQSEKKNVLSILIYAIVKFSGQGFSSMEDNILRILREKPSFVHLPDWIAEELQLKVSRVNSFSEKEKIKPKEVFIPPKTKSQDIVKLKKKESLLRLFDVLTAFEGVKGIDRLRIVIDQKSLAERHVDVICWTQKGIYLFDIHRKDITEEGGVKVFPLNLSWPRNKIRSILRKEPQQEFPFQVYGAIMDFE